MKARRKALDVMDMRRYDWSKVRRGRFASRFVPQPPPVSVRILDEELTVAFPDSESVNAALRAVLTAAKHVKTARPRGKKAA